MPVEDWRPTGLDAVIKQGARRRRHQYVSLLKAVLPITVAAAIVAALIYFTLMSVVGRRDFNNIAWIAAGTALIPIVAVSLLLIGSRRTAPVTLAVAVTIFAAALIVSLMSALRIPMSFFAIAATLPTTLIGVAIANISLVRSLKRSVAILDFPGARNLVQRIGRDVPILAPDDINGDFQRLLVDSDAHHRPAFAPLLARLYLRGIDIEPWPAFLEGHSGRVDISTFDLGDISYSPSQIFYYRSKRLVDIVGALALAVPAIFVGALIFFYIRIIDGGPSIFVQERRGYAGSTFRLFKFRTMAKGNHSTSTAANDPRILPGCRVLRQLRLDELPQLVNILRGDMSFIGPRPVSVSVAEGLEAAIPQYVNRQILQPGLTGWAQVSQGYAESRDEEIVKLSYDLYYLKHVSLDLDVIIAFRTIRTILLRLGAR